MPTVDPDVVAKYLKVQRMFNGATSPGEREAARVALQKLEARYPGIVGAAAAAGAEQAAADARRWNGRAGPVGPMSAEEWQDVFRVAYGAATEFFDWMHRGVEAAEAGVRVRRLLQNGLSSSSREGKNGKVYITLVFEDVEVEGLLDAFEASDAAREIAADLVAAKAREAFVELVAELLPDATEAG